MCRLIQTCTSLCNPATKVILTFHRTMASCCDKQETTRRPKLVAMYKGPYPHVLPCISPFYPIFPVYFLWSPHFPSALLPHLGSQQSSRATVLASNCAFLAAVAWFHMLWMVFCHTCAPTDWLFFAWVSQSFETCTHPKWSKHTKKNSNILQLPCFCHLFSVKAGATWSNSREISRRLLATFEFFSSQSFSHMYMLFLAVILFACRHCHGIAIIIQNTLLGQTQNLFGESLARWNPNLILVDSIPSFCSLYKYSVFTCFAFVAPHQLIWQPHFPCLRCISLRLSLLLGHVLGWWLLVYHVLNVCVCRGTLLK